MSIHPTPIRKAEDSRFGFHYFDKPDQGAKSPDQENDDDIDEEYFEAQTCENDCCDLDCECDDCLRCSTNNMRTDDDSLSYAAAA